MKIKFFDLSVTGIIIVVTTATCLLAFEVLRKPNGELYECNLNNVLSQVINISSEKNKKTDTSYMFRDMKQSTCNKPKLSA